MCSTTTWCSITIFNMKKIYHIPHCSCQSCSDENTEQPSSGRRDFLKSASSLGLGLAFGGAVAGTLEGCGSDAASMGKSSSVRSGKAQHFTILNTADIHSQLGIHDEFFWVEGKPVYKKRGGFATLKTMIDTLRNENPENTVVIDGGDCFQGGGVAALSEGRNIVPLINEVGYDLMLPGNWEVVYGKEMMMQDLGGYNSAKICANMYHDGGDLNGEMIFQPYWIKQMAGVKIGFIGYNDPLTPKRQSPAYSKGITFTDPLDNVAKYVKYLRQYEKCSMVFLVTHMGLTQQIALGNQPQLEGVDYILGADTHERVRKPIQAKYAKVTEPGAFGSFVAKLDVVVEDGVIKDQTYQLLDVDPDQYKPNADMQALVDRMREPYKAELDTVIGKTKSTLVRYYVIENPMDNLITDAVHWKFKPDIALSNGFRFCPPLVVDNPEQPQEITNDFLWSMLPVNSQARSGEVKGSRLKEWLEKELENVFSVDPAKRFGGWVVRFKGMEMNFTSEKPMGERINWIKIAGEPMDPNRSYKVIACEREGDPEDMLCRIKNVENPVDLPDYLHDVIREYLKEHSPVEPKVEGRVTCTDLPQNVLSQLDGYEYEFV